MKHLLLLVVLLVLASACKTHQVVERAEYYAVHDTVIVMACDTEYVVKTIQTSHDSAYVERELVVEDDKGNVKRTDKTTIIRIKDSSKDSTDSYRSKYAALLKLYSQMSDKYNKVVEVKKVKDHRGWVCFFLLMGLNAAYIYTKIRKKWLH